MKNLIIITLLVSGTSFAQFLRGPIQTNDMGVLDGNYIKETVPTKKVIQYDYVREADVMWSKRVWSVIDLRQKFNHPLYYPNDDIQYGQWNRNANVWSLWTIIRNHILNGDLTLYSPFNPSWESWKDGDSFKYPIMSHLPGGNYFNDKQFQEDAFIYLGEEIVNPYPIAVKSYLDPSIDSTVILPDGTEAVVYEPNDTLWYRSQDIVQYVLKEDWYFDKEKSKMERRIIGIAPVIYTKDSNGNITGTRELFWLYFPQCRYVFQNYYYANRHNDAQLMSLDDMFWKRIFQSYAIKESNTYNRAVDEYKAGVDALLEANRIKENIDNFEHNLWAY